MKRSELQRKSPLRRKSFVNRISERQRLENLQLKRVRDVVRIMAGGRCQATIEHECDGRGVHAHHIRRRSQGGTHEVSNLLWTCAAGHHAIHSRPAEAVKLGLLARSSGRAS